MALDSKFVFGIIKSIAEPMHDFLIKNSNFIREYFFRNEYAAIVLSVFIAICIIKNDFAFILMCFSFYVLLYILLWKYVAK